MEPQLWGLLCLGLRLLGTPHPMQPPHKQQQQQQQLNVTSWLLLSPRKGLCAEARAEPHWFKLASAPAQGETLCRNSVRNIETTTTTQTTTQWYELASALAPEKDSLQKLGLNRTGSSWLLLPPRERLCAETRSETLRQRPPNRQQQLHGTNWLLLSLRKRTLCRNSV